MIVLDTIAARLSTTNSKPSAEISLTVSMSLFLSLANALQLLLTKGAPPAAKWRARNVQVRAQVYMSLLLLQQIQMRLASARLKQQ